MDKFVEKQSFAKMAHIIKENIAHVPAMLKLYTDIKKEYLETVKAEGVITAVLCAYKTTDTVIEKGLANTPHKISCLNCTSGYCCHQNVEICEAEAKVIAQYCKENKIPIPIKHLQQQLIYSRDKISTADCSACVFLKGNRCGIYPVRPFNCRTYLSASPIEHCDAKKYKNMKVATLPIAPAEIISAVVFEVGGKSGRMPKMLIKYSS
jgi:Fe-S-cluster containining protein